MNNKTEDLFNFRDYVLFLKDKLDNTNYSQVVGVHGDYGAGKTTTMNLVKQLYLEDETGIDNVLEFSAWRNYYNNEKTVWKALLYELSGKIYEIFEKLGEENNNFDIKNKENIIKYTKETCKEIQYNLYQNLKDFNGELKNGKSEAEKNKFTTGFKIIKSIIDTLKGQGEGVSELIKLLKKEEQELKKIKIDSLEIIQRKFNILLGFYNLIEIKEKKVPPLIIMIDDLDRILPEKSVEIIEILRIFFEKSQKIHFICAIDIRVIEKGIERKFNQLNQGGDLSRIEFEEYLEKIITIPFDLPAIPLVDFDKENGILGIDSLIDENFLTKNKEIINIQVIKIENIIINDFLKTNKVSNIIEHINEYYLNTKNKKEANKNYLNENEVQLFKKYFKFNKIIFSSQDNEKLKVEIDDEKYNIYYSELEKRIKEIKDIKKTNENYNNNISNILNGSFKKIIKTGLQSNPRKIKRFIEVFEIYFKILIYRNLKYENSEKIEIKKYSCLLAKMLIIKLEWDEVYREFVKDKFYIGLLEQISRFEIGDNNQFDSKESNFIISYNLNKFIKQSKIYKMDNLYGMLSIEDFFWKDNSIKEGEEMKKELYNYILNIYSVYYLFNNINQKITYIENENIENIYKFNLLKYLYEKDEVRVNNYIKIFSLLSSNNNEKKDKIEETKKIIFFYKSYLEETENENVKLNNLLDNLNKNEK